MLRLSHRVAEQIQRLAKESYPYECGGFLAGKASSDKEAMEVYPMRNENDLQPKVRFEINPKDFKKVENDATRKGLELLVFFHSHPDHPALPSAFDAERAAGLAPFWPNLSYLIVSVEKTARFELSSWVFVEAKGGFEKEDIVIV